MATAIVSARAAPAKPRSRPTPSHKDWSTSGPERPVTHQLSGERAPGRSPDPYRRKHDAALAHYSAAMWPGFPPPLTPAPFSETNNGCQIKFELSHMRL